MVARKTKRVALVTAVSASLMMAGAAAFATNDTPQCQWPGKGQGKGAPSDHDPGKGYLNGWQHRKCKDKDSNGGNPNPNPSPNPNPGPGGTDSGGDDDHGISVHVSVHVDLPDIDLPNGGLMVDSALDHVQTAADQTRMLADDDVARLIEIVQAAGEGATSLADGTIVQAGVSVSGTSGSGTVNVSSGAVGGATTLGSGLTNSTLNLVSGNVTGAGSIFGSMLSML